jgi:serine/threonine protein kinase
MSGLDVDTRSDVYSLGVLLYELLTGTTPFPKGRFRQASYDEIRRIIREEEPPRPSTRLSTTEELPSIAANRGVEPRKLARLVHGELDWVVMKCLEKDRNRRDDTANGLARDIERYLADEPVQACPPSAWYRLRKFARRNRRALVTAALLAPTIILGGAPTRWRRRRRGAPSASRVGWRSCFGPAWSCATVTRRGRSAGTAWPWPAAAWRTNCPAWSSRPRRTRPTIAWPNTSGTIATTCSRSCVIQDWTQPTGERSWQSASGSSSARSAEAAGPGRGRGRSRCCCRCGGRAGSRGVRPRTSSVNSCAARR